MTLAEFNLVLLAGTAVLLAAVVGVRLSSRASLPSLLVYLAIGVAIGEAGLGIRFDDVSLTQNLGLLALAVILAEGGLTTRWSDIRPALGFAVVLSTLGVLVSVAVVAAVSYALLDIDLRTAVLLGAVVSSTDAAAVFSVLRRLPLRRWTAAALEAESGLNDPPVVILVSLVAGPAWEQEEWGRAAVMVVLQLVGGAAVGVAAGWLGERLLAWLALPSAGLYPLTSMGVALLAYAGGSSIGVSGLLAAYLSGLWLGNATLPHRRTTLGFAEGAAWLAQIGLFVMLGLLASPERLPAAVLPALVVGATLTLVARPLSMITSAVWFRFVGRRIGWRDQAFLSWAGLRGAVPIVLTTIPATAGLPGATTVFDVVFLLVVLFTLLQGPTLAPVARWLGVISADPDRDVEVEAAPLDELRGDVVQVTIGRGSGLSGVHVDDLRLPAGALANLVVRDGVPFVPDPNTRLRSGDRVLVVTTSGSRAATERRLRAVSHRGRLARWHGEQGLP